MTHLDIYTIHSLTEMFKKCKYQKVFFCTKNCVVGESLEVVFEIIYIGRLLLTYIDFHAGLISNSAIRTFLGHPV